MDEKTKFEVRGSNEEVRSAEGGLSPLPSNLELRTSIPRLRTSSVSLWSGIFAGPLAFAINLQLRYALVHWACEHGSRSVLLWIALPLVLVCVAGAFLSWRSLEGRTPSSARRGEAALSRGWADEGVRPSKDAVERRVRFMAYSGLMLSAIFAITILASMIPDFYLSPCD